MAFVVHLTPKTHKELRRRKKNERDAKILRRLLCIELKDLGEQNRKIARLCGVCIDTITDWLRLYEDGGFEKLCFLAYEGRRISVLDAVKGDLKKGIKEGRYKKLADVREELKRVHGLDLCISRIWQYAKKNSLHLSRRPS